MLVLLLQPQLWDLRMETSPVLTFKIHEYLRPKVTNVVLAPVLNLMVLFLYLNAVSM